VIRSVSRKSRKTKPTVSKNGINDYFRIRDFEYVQPLYDLAFLLEVDALAKGIEVPRYRTFSLWRAGYSLDGYSTTIDRWLTGEMADENLDYVPSARIRQYLTKVRKTGTLPELRPYRSERFDRCLRLRSVRGLGPSTIALAISSRSPEDWPGKAALSLTLNRDRITELYEGAHTGPWQTAHVVPPLLRFLNTVQFCLGEPVAWDVSGIQDPFDAITTPLSVAPDKRSAEVFAAVAKALRRERLFHREPETNAEHFRIKHQMGWAFTIKGSPDRERCRPLCDLVRSFDPLAEAPSMKLLSDLHLHSAWSDGSASVDTMAKAVVASGLAYFAVTDHSRTSKLQSGLTPPIWLRQANALSLVGAVCPVLHGVEVDILHDGMLDLPHSLLAAADIVVASVHSNWTDDARFNTDRLVRAIESGKIDVLAHPTSAVIGKPGVPDYLRPRAEVYWNEIFEKCALWRVAVELNCFPSRLDLPLELLRNAISAGCPISIGSDAHARSHLLNLRFGAAALRRLRAPTVLNRLSYDELKAWIAESRSKRGLLTKSALGAHQMQLHFPSGAESPRRILQASITPPSNIPAGSRVVGIDLTAGEKSTGVALLDEFTVTTCSLTSDEDLLNYIGRVKPTIVSIDSPLGLPGGRDSIDPKAGIVRVAEHDLASIGIPAYPALIDSMRNLTLRGIRLRQSVESLAEAPQVIESYPGAAQDILSVPRKQKSLTLLREGLRRLGLEGTGLDTRSHDEMDAITAAIVGRYFEAGLFEPMGIPREGQLIVPKVRPLTFQTTPVICLAGKTGAGKSVVARYLSVFYGFEWIQTRDIIRKLLIEDATLPPERRLATLDVNPSAITEKDLRQFGAIVLDVHKQVPVREKLTKTVRDSNQPIVVDSIRDTIDLDSAAIGERILLTWFIDCDDAVIRQRLSTKTKLGEKRIASPSRVDHTAGRMRAEADDVISNNRTLEELRWRVDDALFERVVLSVFKPSHAANTGLWIPASRTDNEESR
jgi:histidinol phosphatase-like PHP family hydrolase/predicted nuclease with RNAse H fold/dephospho-CoA kinase